MAAGGVGAVRVKGPSVLVTVQNSVAIFRLRTI